MWWNNSAAHVGVVSKRGSNARTGRQAKGTFLVIAYSQGVSQSAIDAAWDGGGQDRPRQRTQCNSHELKTLVPFALERVYGLRNRAC